MTTKWEHKDEWWQRGGSFLVVVKHSEEKPAPWRHIFDNEGLHRWYVYAWIYPEHPLFGKFEGEDVWQPATEALPLHAGCSYCREHFGRDIATGERNTLSYQVGADYNHLHDAIYTHMETAGQASSVFADAQELYNYLESMK